MLGRHTQGAARRDLRRLGDYEREMAVEWAVAIEERMREFALASRLMTGVEEGILRTAFPHGFLDPSYGIARMVTHMGYTARILDRESLVGIVRDHDRAVRRTQPDWDRPSTIPARWSEQGLDELIPREASGAIDYERVKDPEDETLATLVDYVTAYVSDPELFDRMVLCDPGRWNAMTSIITVSVQKNISTLKTGDRHLFAVENVDHLMRVGYAMRCVDEALRENPLTSREVEAGVPGGGRVVKSKRKRGSDPR